jgi:predicted dehydrogenase
VPIRPSKLMRAALVGCGSMGSFYVDELAGYTGRTFLPIGHAEVLQTNARTELIAGADPDVRRLDDFSRRWGVDRLYSDHLAMLERERPDIVSIASPPALHPQHVIDCAERGVKGIFCEKPLAPSLREADAMLQAVTAHGVQLCINHTLRGDPFHQAARRLIREGAIGELLTISISWAGRLFLTGTHRFDLVNYMVSENPTAWLVGHAEEPASHQTVVPTQRGIDVGGTAYVVYENGVRAFFNGRDGLPTNRLEISGTDGMMMIDTQEAQLWKSSQNASFGGLARYPFPQMMRYTAPMVFLLEDLIEAMEGGREPMSNGHTARHALAQILATHDSSLHDNCKVIFPFEKLDMTPPYRWFTPDGKPIDEAHGVGTAV